MTGDNDEEFSGTDQTNGLAGDLEGDDGGALDPEAHKGSLFEEVIDHGLDIDSDRDDEGDEAVTEYSEEGE